MTRFGQRTCSRGKGRCVRTKRRNERACGRRLERRRRVTTVRGNGEGRGRRTRGSDKRYGTKGEWRKREVTQMGNEGGGDKGKNQWETTKEEAE